MDAAYSEKLKRPRMGMVADMVERDSRKLPPRYQDDDDEEEEEKASCIPLPLSYNLL